jgi:regulatory protein
MQTHSRQITKKEAISLITAYCSRQERCIAEVVSKLKSYEIPDTIIEEIIFFLKQEKYIDELRYATAFASDKFRFNKWGRIKIGYALKTKHIPEEIITSAVNSIDSEQYTQQLSDELQKKKKSLKKLSDFELNGKLYQFAAGRGFESDVIRLALSQLV